LSLKCTTVDLPEINTYLSKRRLFGLSNEWSYENVETWHANATFNNKSN